jgi:hypothetical protein
MPLNSRINTLLIHGNYLYAGGIFTSAGGILVNRIAKWDLVNGGWSPLMNTNGQNGVNSEVLSLAIHNDILYVGGIFTNASGATAGRIASYNLNTSTWSGFSSGNLGSTVRALAIINNKLYAGGDFQASTSVNPLSGIGVWDIQNGGWSVVGGGLSNFANIWSFAVNGDILYAAGIFSTAGGNSMKYIAAFDTTNNTWSSLDIDTQLGLIANDQIITMKYYNNNLYVGGTLSNNINNPTFNIFKWNGISWSSVGSGCNGIVRTLVVGLNNTYDYLYVGGEFTTAGGISAEKIASYGPI